MVLKLHQHIFTDTEITAAQVNPDDQTEIVIPLAAQVTTASNITAFTLRLPSDFAKDLSIAENTSEAAVVTFNVEAGVNNSADTTKPVYDSGTGVSVSAGNVINIPITEANALDSTTVLDLNNYRLDGAPLPAGTYVTISGTAPNFVVHLNLPSGSISESRNYSLNVSGIKDKAGNTIDAFAVNTVALVDDVKPELKTAVLNTNGSLTLGYSESLAATIAAADLAITLNGKVVDSGSVTVVAGTGAEAGKDVVTVQLSVFDGGDGYNNGNEVLYIDADGVAGYSSTDDITISTGTYDASVAGTNYNLNNASTLKVATVASPTTADAAGNTIKGNTTITVK